jgi:4-oxalocrotonate tautomerase
MPYINVQFTKGATKEAKREIVKGVTDLMVEHLGKRPEHVHVVIQGVEFEDWGFAGKLVAELSD